MIFIIPNNGICEYDLTSDINALFAPDADDAAFDATFTHDADPLEVEVDRAFDDVTVTLSAESAEHRLRFSGWELARMQAEVES